MEYEKAGDPMGKGLMWTRKTSGKIAEQLEFIGIKVSEKTVERLVTKMGFKLRCNRKDISRGGKQLTAAEKETKNQQFLYIKKKSNEFFKNNLPVLSCDSKKKEPIGNFKNAGTRLKREADLVYDHDFATYGIGRALIYGLFDYYRKEGYVYVGESLYDKKQKRFLSSDTPEFAAENIARWWQDYGQKRYPHAKEILILADAGGSNGPTVRIWKAKLFELLCKEHGLKLTICHYPAGSSRYNPIEHRLFSEISKNWKGTPLTSYEMVSKYIRTTKTKTGLKAHARIVTKKYEKGKKISDTDYSAIKIKSHNKIPKLNYTLSPN
jgi:hypothetical protein